jgi:TRAP-type C4-dicarboxylate transport system substrate-binding protein
VYGGLSDADKQALVEAAKKAAQAMRDFVDNVEKNGVEQLKSEGMEVVTTVDRKSFEDAVAPAYEDYYKRFDKKLIDDIRNTR